jgi:hypothetical protein
MNVGDKVLAVDDSVMAVHSEVRAVEGFHMNAEDFESTDVREIVTAWSR